MCGRWSVSLKALVGPRVSPFRRLSLYQHCCYSGEWGLGWIAVEQAGKLPSGQRGRRQWQRRQRRREVWVNQWWVQRQGSYPQLNCGGWYRGTSVVAWLVPQRVRIVKIGIRQKRRVLGWLWSQPGRWWNRQPWCASAKTGLVSPSSGRWILGVGFYPAFKVICVLQTWGWEERETSASWGSFMDKSHGHSKMHLVEWNTT